MKKDRLLQRVRRITTTVLMLVVSLACTTVVNASEEDEDDGWHFAITPYLWLPNINGTMKLSQPSGFVDGEMSYGPNDYLEDLDFVGMLDLQVLKGRWSFMGDIIYLGFSGNDTAHFPGVLPSGGGWDVEGDWEFQAAVYQLAGGYSVFRNEYSNINLLAGVRWADIDAEVNLDIEGPVPGWISSRGFSERKTYVDPIFGFNGNFELGKNWFIPYYLDIGGFSVSSDLTVQGFTAIGYHFVDWFSMALGYRYLYYDFGDSKLVEDLSLYGVSLGLRFTF